MRFRVSHLVAAAIVGGITVAGSAVLVARQQPTVPGTISTAKFLVVNKSLAESVPVTLTALDPKFPVLATSVTNMPDVTLSDRTIARLTEPVRQTWDYAQFTLTADTDPVARLNASGREGWELVSVLAGARGTTYTFKRSLR